MKGPNLSEQLAEHLENRERHGFAQQVDAEASTAERERIERGVIALLEGWRKWYSEDLFRPWTIKEAQTVHAEFPNAVDRISAESARSTIDHIIADIKAGKHLDADESLAQQESG